mgnify:CR=1 FL=1
MENKKKLWVWILIVILVVLGLVYITINKNKIPERTETSGQGDNINMENTQNITGVKITILKEGSGDAAKAGDVVAMNYTGALLDGKVFDSNVDPKFEHVEPFVFNLGAGQVIKGWDTGIVGMKVGEKRKLEIEPSFAYGDRAIGDLIPANSTLVFEVELLAIKK